MKSPRLAKMKFFIAVLIIFALHMQPTLAVNAKATEDAVAEHISYDQRQTGKYNIHVSIKDVAIVEISNDIMDESFNEEDYYYDEGDLTVKPIQLHPTSTLKPQTVNNLLTTTTAQQTTTLASVTSTEAPLTTIAALPTSVTASSNENLSHHNITYSPNLLADIESTRAVYINKNKKSILNSTTKSVFPTSMPTLSTLLQRTPNVVILENNLKTYDSPSSTHMPPAAAIKITGRSKDMPLSYSTLDDTKSLKAPLSIFENAFVPSPNSQVQQNRAPSSSSDASGRRMNDSKIFTFKTRRAHKAPPESEHGQAGVAIPVMKRTFCRSNQYRDASGHCRIKRSSSILKKLFIMLASLPFANDRKNFEAA